MSSILIPATKSLTVTNKLPNGNINKDTLIVGNDGMYNYISYLYFDISAIPSNVYILNAELILFKMNDFYNDSKKEFSIYPLRDYFSTYTTFNNRPRVNATMKRNFYPIIKNVAVTVNLTYFVTLWLNNKLTNTGISLSSKNKNIITEFGSSICKDTYIVPFIKVAISDECDVKRLNCNIGGSTIRQVRVTGTVPEDSQYEAIVNIGVKRKESGYTDNYYVVDEYNNLLNDKPLQIDKTYNMVVSPPKTPGDVETLDLYGSYKS
ncbi:DNRLRE domain-containing protein [Clostridium sp.]